MHACMDLQRRKWYLHSKVPDNVTTKNLILTYGESSINVDDLKSEKEASPPMK